MTRPILSLSVWLAVSACGPSRVEPPIGHFVLDETLTTQFTQTRLVGEGEVDSAEAATRAARLAKGLAGEIHLRAYGTGDLQLQYGNSGAIDVDGAWELEGRRVALAAPDDAAKPLLLDWIDGSRALHLVTEVDGEQIVVVFLAVE